MGTNSYSSQQLLFGYRHDPRVGQLTEGRLRALQAELDQHLFTNALNELTSRRQETTSPRVQRLRQTVIVQWIDSRYPTTIDPGQIGATAQDLWAETNHLCHRFAQAFDQLLATEDPVDLAALCAFDADRSWSLLTASSSTRSLARSDELLQAGRDSTELFALLATHAHQIDQAVPLQIILDYAVNIGLDTRLDNGQMRWEATLQTALKEYQLEPQPVQQVVGVDDQYHYQIIDAPNTCCKSAINNSVEIVQHRHRSCLECQGRLFPVGDHLDQAVLHIWPLSVSAIRQIQHQATEQVWRTLADQVRRRAILDWAYVDKLADQAVRQATQEWRLQQGAS